MSSVDLSFWCRVMHLTQTDRKRQIGENDIVILRNNNNNNNCLFWLSSFFFLLFFRGGGKDCAGPMERRGTQCGSASGEMDSGRARTTHLGCICADR